MQLGSRTQAEQHEALVWLTSPSGALGDRVASGPTSIPTRVWLQLPAKGTGCAPRGQAHHAIGAAGTGARRAVDVSLSTKNPVGLTGVLLVTVSGSKPGRQVQA